MTTKERITIFPSRANHVLMKSRIVSANKGLSLLKRKRDALELKMREIIALRSTVSNRFEELFAESIFSIAKANFLDTDFKPAPIIGSDRADAFMRLNFTKTIGIQLPQFEPVIRKSESLPLTGLAHGGGQVEVVRENFQELLRVVILLASYNYSIRILSDAIRSNSMRLNGLEFVVIPRLVNTSIYIRDELDELEREEFYRLKCSQAKQRKIKNRIKQDRSGGPPIEEGRSYVDASTETDFDEEEIINESQEMLSSTKILKKRKITEGAQTIISGYYPSSTERISTTDSIISGPVPTVVKRSTYDVYEQQPRQMSWEPETESSTTDNKTSKITNLFTGTDSSIPPSSTNKIPGSEIGAQTEITGRFPKRSELQSPNLRNSFDQSSKEKPKSSVVKSESDADDEEEEGEQKKLK